MTTGLVPALEKSSDPRVVSLIHTFPFPHSIELLVPLSINLFVVTIIIYSSVPHSPILHSPILSFSQVTVSSGGMLVTKLDPHDLQFENFRNFDGTFAYAQNKRQQVVMTRQWSTQWPDIHFSSMHPGKWVELVITSEKFNMSCLRCVYTLLPPPPPPFLCCSLSIYHFFRLGRYTR